MSQIKTRPFDVSNYLNDEAHIAAYLQAAIEDGDPALLAAALGDIARARGMLSIFCIGYAIVERQVVVCRQREILMSAIGQ